MRELKFRAWDERKMIMHYNFEFIRSGEGNNDWIIFKSDKQSLDWEKISNERTIHPFNNPYPVQQLKIMQFTGLLDKNGKEIFEGDIVQDSRKSCNPHLYTVIGNIYENPKLLDVR